MHVFSRYNIVKRASCGAFIGIVAGCGRNRGTWDAEHSRRTAQRHAAALRRQDAASRYTVEAST